MNEIKVSVNFKTGKCIAYGYDPVDNDYNASKLVFNFDEEYDGRKVVEIRPEDSSSKEATFASEIINNEVILAKEVAGEYHSIFTTSGRHIIEVHLYSNGSKVTAICEKPFYVREEQINIGDKQSNVYLPVFEQMIQELNTGLDNLSSGLNSLNNAITETNNLDLDVSKTDKEATVTIRKKDNTTKSITLSDGTSLMFHWRGTYLGIKTDKDDEYTYVNLQGIQGEKGETGAPFRIKKTYANIQLMIADYDNMQVDDHVMISGNVEQEDNAKLFTKTETEDPIYRWQYLGDFSGATGIQGETGLTPNIQIGSVVSGDSPSVTRTGTNENPILNFVLQKGEKGDTGNTGATGPTGNGIVSIIKTSTEGLVDTYTITYTNGTTTTFQITNGEDGEVTQAQLDAVQEEVDDLRRNQKQDTASGTNIYVDDAFDTRIMESRMSKESTQETTSGKQLFDYNSFKNIGVTHGTGIFENNGIKLTASDNDCYTYYSEAAFGDYLKVNEGDEIILSWEADTNTNGNVYIFPNGEVSGNVSTNNIFTEKQLSYTVPSGITFITMRFGVTNSGDTIGYKNITVRKSGTPATPYEPYTGGQASPNPSYPQEVKTVKGYRNLFDGEMEQGSFMTTDGSEVISATRIRSINYINVSNGNYTISLAQSNMKVVVYVYDLEGTFKSSESYISWLSLPYTFTFQNNRKIRFAISYSNGANIVPSNVSNIQLVEGTEALPYVPYGNNYVDVKVIGENILKYDLQQLKTLNSIGTWNNNVYTFNGLTVKVNNDLSVDINGTNSSAGTAYFVLNNNYRLNANQNYTLSGCPSGGSVSTYYISADIPGVSTSLYDGGSGQTKSFSEEIVGLAVRIVIRQGASVNNKIFKPMITTNGNTNYEPYKESIVTIPLNGNEIAGIGDYKDELIVDSKGKCWLNKKIGKAILDGSENWTYYSPALVFFTDAYNSLFNTNVNHSVNNILSNYYKAGSYTTDNNVITINNIGRIHIRNDDIATVNDFKNWLSTHNTLVYSDVATPEPIDLNYTVDIRLFNGVNHISNSDDMDMEIKYVQDINQIINNITNAMLEIGGN